MTTKTGEYGFLVGMAVFAIGCSAVFGYLFNCSFLYHWTVITIPGSSQMALNTAVAITLIGLDLTLIARKL